MITAARLNNVFKDAKEKEIRFDDSSKFILFSDCHRGDNSWADDFAHNQNIFFHALNYYFQEEYTYIELGDANEAWENDMEDIKESHSHVFWMMRKFFQEERLKLIWGNHDNVLKDSKKYLEKFHNAKTNEEEDLFPGIQVHEGLVLKHSETGKSLFLTHGHQGQLFNDLLPGVNKVPVKTIWKVCQKFGVKDPTSPAKNFKKRRKVGSKITKWAEKKKQAIIVGHTHRPAFPTQGTSQYYFNTGSCVHPRCITGIEIIDGAISLVKWFICVSEWNKPVKTENIDTFGSLVIAKKILEGPKKLRDFWEQDDD